MKPIYGLGHSTHTQTRFIKLLRAHNITCLVDVRSYPGSRHCPHFNKEVMPGWLGEHGIEYIHYPVLGGRRKALYKKEESKQAFDNVSFRSYAEYMETDDFKKGVEGLIEIAEQAEGGTAIFCSEGNPYRCHRSMIMDYLNWIQYPVVHLSSCKTAKPHTHPPRLYETDGVLVYH